MKENADNSQDLFESAFWHFIVAVRKLACSSEQQSCEGVGFETPWEMRDNFFIGLESILNSPATPLTAEQRLTMNALGELLHNLPADAVSPPYLQPNSHLSCSIAMGHPGWSVVRSRAAELISVLQPLISRNQAYFEATD